VEKKILEEKSIALLPPQSPIHENKNPKEVRKMIINELKDLLEKRRKNIGEK